MGEKKVVKAGKKIVKNEKKVIKGEIEDTKRILNKLQNKKSGKRREIIIIMLVLLVGIIGISFVQAYDAFRCRVDLGISDWECTTDVSECIQTQPFFDVYHEACYNCHCEDIDDDGLDELVWDAGVCRSDYYQHASGTSDLVKNPIPYSWYYTYPKIDDYNVYNKQVDIESCPTCVGTKVSVSSEQMTTPSGFINYLTSCDMPECKDNDGLENFYYKSITRGLRSGPMGLQKKPWVDYCVNNNIVADFGCQTDVDVCAHPLQVRKDTYFCPNGCENGACLPDDSGNEGPTDPAEGECTMFPVPIHLYPTRHYACVFSDPEECYECHIHGVGAYWSGYIIESTYESNTANLAWVTYYGDACNKLPGCPINPGCEGDANKDYIVDFLDFAIYASHFGEDDCSIDNFCCGGADLDNNGAVDVDYFNDLGLISDNWLEVC